MSHMTELPPYKAHAGIKLPPLPAQAPTGIALCAHQASRKSVIKYILFCVQFCKQNLVQNASIGYHHTHLAILSHTTNIMLRHNR